ncbi:MAG: cytochrome c [Persephonella sp.]|nr:MAG: cytochrome c [Persephonella sp.]
MKRKILLGLGFIFTVSLASCNTQAKEAKSELQQNDLIVKRGYEVYKAKCSSCHIESINRNEIMKIKKEIKMGKRPPLNAPPMNEVSARLKVFFKDEKSFKDFVKDYITNPSREKGKCMPMAFKMFGVMPPIGKSLTEEEKEAVATWLYRAFNQKWEDFHKGKKCRMRMKMNMEK